MFNTGTMLWLIFLAVITMTFVIGLKLSAINETLHDINITLIRNSH